jgi:multicomponent Na+:H+ antiporter subunit D
MTMAMGIAAFFCLLVGCYLPFLYDMLPNPDEVYHPYTTYHFGETLQILALTALGFFYFKNKIGARATISFDLDWFYRKGGQVFLWLAKKPIQAVDTAWGEVYRVVGLSSLMTTAKFSSWFDWHGIDGVVDGTARLVRKIGGHVSSTLQRGQIQQTLYFTISFAAILLFAFAWL